MKFLGTLITALVLQAAPVIAAEPASVATEAGKAAAVAANTVAPATSENARDVLARVRPAVIQIKGFFGANTAQAFHGTGFAVAEGGVFMTNYHVVAQQVQYPDKFRLEYRTPEGKTGKVSVVSVDVRHDLAVVRAVDHSPAPVKLVPAIPVKGERAYSVGFPLDVGLTITEGVSNGAVEDSFDPRIHYSGAINGGMSGGPALNATGHVIGVNVSGYRFEQLVSFLVPAEHAQALLRRSLTAPPDDGKRRNEVQTQMRGHAAALLGALKQGMPTQAVAGYRLPAKLAPFIDCNASGDPTPNQPVQVTRINCSAKAGLYVEQGLYSGDLRYSHFVLSTDKLDAWRFVHRLSELASATDAYGSRRHGGPFSCENRNLRLTGFDASVLVCVRSYRKLEGLYDFTVRVSSLNGVKRGFASHLDMFGLDFDAGMSFIRRDVDAMEWTP